MNEMWIRIYLTQKLQRDPRFSVVPKGLQGLQRISEDPEDPQDLKRFKGTPRISKGSRGPPDS